MSAQILWELRFLLLSFVWGLWLMAAYDGLRIFRGLFRHGWLWISLEDFLYWLTAALAVFSFLYREDDGIVRWYALFGIAVGMLFWNRTASPLLVRFFVTLFQKILGMIRRPFLFLARIWKKRLKKTAK